MTRIIPTLSLALCALSLSACGEKQTAPANDTGNTSTAVEAHISADLAQDSADTAPKPPSSQPVSAEPSVEFAGLPAPYADADYARGKRVWRQCSSCHTVSVEADHLVGPNLYGLFGRQVGSSEDFNYSQAIQEANFIWTPEKLDEWLTSPRNFLPGNRMSFAGVRKPQDRINVIAYLMVASSQPTE